MKIQEIIVEQTSQQLPVTPPPVAPGASTTPTATVQQPTITAPATGASGATGPTSAAQPVRTAGYLTLLRTMANLDPVDATELLRMLGKI